MLSCQTVLVRLFLVVNIGLIHGTLASGSSTSRFPTAEAVFKDGSDPMLITLTYLSYLQWDQQDHFRTYKLMYGLEDWKRAKLENYLPSQVEQYKKKGWTVEFLDVGKGFLFNKDSPGAVIAYKCGPSLEKDHPKTCEVKIAFRGTRSLDDWGNNLNFLKTRLRFVDTRIDKSRYQTSYKVGQVHQGFLNAYNTASQKISDIFDKLRTENPDAQFWIRIGGHSLGSSLATLCAAHMAMKFKDDLKKTKNMIHLETYGSPRTLGVKLSGELTGFLGKDNILRFVNKDDKGKQDMVTMIPFGRGLTGKFLHIGDKCILTAMGAEIYEGFPKVRILRTPHRIEGYRLAYLKERKCGVEEKAPLKEGGKGGSFLKSRVKTAKSSGNKEESPS